MIYKKINNITDKHKLEREFAKKFPEENFKEWYELIDKEYKIRQKHVQGMGNFLFFMSKGKTQFHEFILDKLIQKLKNNGIKYRRGKVRKGADLFIFKDKRYPVELETGLYERAGKRKKLKQRSLSYKEDTVIIIVLNTNEKQKYKKSELPYIPKEIKILTIGETIELFKGEPKHVF